MEIPPYVELLTPCVAEEISIYRRTKKGANVISQDGPGPGGGPWAASWRGPFFGGLLRGDNHRGRFRRMRDRTSLGLASSLQIPRSIIPHSDFFRPPAEHPYPKRR